MFVSGRVSSFQWQIPSVPPNSIEFLPTPSTTTDLMQSLKVVTEYGVILFPHALIPLLFQDVETLEFNIVEKTLTNQVEV